METLAIVQARMGSSRLPGKVLLPLAEKPVIEHVVERVRLSSRIDEVVVATSISPDNLPLVRFCAEKGYRVFVGSEEDVLDRYYQAARLFAPDHVVRITADCPLVDPEIIDAVIQSHFEAGADHTSNGQPPTLPDGYDTEIFTFSSLHQAWKSAQLKSEREHVTQYMVKNRGRFRLNNYLYHTDFSGLRLTLDEPDDYRLLNIVFSELYPHHSFFDLKAVLGLFSRQPDLEKINAHINRNEGLEKSLKQDGKASIIE